MFKDVCRDVNGASSELVGLGQVGETAPAGVATVCSASNRNAACTTTVNLSNRFTIVDSCEE